MTVDKSSGSFPYLRLTAAQIVYDVFEQGAYTNLSLEKKLRGSSWSSEDRNFLTEIVNGSVRMVKHLDWVLNHFLTLPINNQHPWLRAVLRISVYQLLFLDKIPDYAVVNDAVTIVRKKINKKISGVANGVLRNIIRNQKDISYPEDPAEYLQVYYSYPDWLVDLLMQEYGYDKCKQILEYNNQRPEVFLRTNTLRCKRSELLEMLHNEGVACEPGFFTPWDIKISHSKVYPGDTNAYKQGAFYFQNPASMMAGAILNPQPDETVIDLCCGVGGKSTHMAELMNNYGRIKAYDYYPQKIDLLNENALRLGIKIIAGQVADIENMAIDLPASKVLLDVPCSGLGVLNRRADLRWRKSMKEIETLSSIQIKLLKKASEMVKPGGQLLYSTCTITDRENMQVVSRFLKDNKHIFSLEGFGQRLTEFALDSSDRNQAECGMITIIPGKYQTDGMFYASMRRKS